MWQLNQSYTKKISVPRCLYFWEINLIFADFIQFLSVMKTGKEQCRALKPPSAPTFRPSFNIVFQVCCLSHCCKGSNFAFFKMLGILRTDVCSIPVYMLPTRNHGIMNYKDTCYLSNYMWCEWEFCDRNFQHIFINKLQLCRRGGDLPQWSSLGRRAV